MKYKSLFVISVLLILSLLFGGAGQVRAADIVHVYELNGNYLDELGGPALIPNGNGSLSDGGYLVPDHGSGLSLQNAINPGNYSIEMLVRLDGYSDPSLCSGGDHICSSKIIDFKNLTSDDGLYAPSGGDASDGRLQLCCNIVVESPEGTIVYGETTHLVLTRDGTTDAIVGYVNGLKVISIVDTLDMTTFDGPGNLVHFLMDDSAVMDDPPIGFIDRIRIYNGPLSAKEVFNLAVKQPWMQVNETGFGNLTNKNISALEVFGTQLYAGTQNPSEGATIWRSDDGTNWNQVSDPGFSDVYTNTNNSITDMIVFQSKLYAGTGWRAIPGQIWRSGDGTTWEQVVADGFGSPSNLAIAAFGIFSDTLYVSTHDDGGLEIWRSVTGDSGGWTRVVAAGNGQASNIVVTGFMEFKGMFYAAVENGGTDGAEIWRTSDGLAWDRVVTGGFNSTHNSQTGGFAIFNETLYVGTRNEVTGGQLWKSSDGSTWTQVIENGFGDVNNVKFESVRVYNDALYVGAGNNVTGVEIWRSYDGLAWSQINADGFGDGNAQWVLWNSSSAIFNQNLYYGVGNFTPEGGGQIWMLLRQVFLPLVIK
jgi:hypothetical protein